jgi:hypothetical protein
MLLSTRSAKCVNCDFLFCLVLFFCFFLGTDFGPTLQEEFHGLILPKLLTQLESEQVPKVSLFFSPHVSFFHF